MIPSFLPSSLCEKRLMGPCHKYLKYFTRIPGGLENDVFAPYSAHCTCEDKVKGHLGFKDSVKM